MDSRPAIADPTPPRLERRRRERPAFRKTRRPEERIRLLGQTMDLMRPEEVLHHVETWVARGQKKIIANHNLHSLYLVRRCPEMQRFYDRAELVEVDSTPLVHFAKGLGLNGRGFHRCTYLDWREHFWSVADRKAWRVFYVGGEQATLDTAMARLSERYAGAVLEGRNGYFDAAPDSADTRALLAQIKAFRPDVLFVGMGMPRQEIWVSQTFDRLPDCAIFSVGAAFDYEAGAQKTPPRWMGRLGIEWLYRLAADPRRLFTRYCVEPWSLIGPAWNDIRMAARRVAEQKAAARSSAD